MKIGPLRHRVNLMKPVTVAKDVTGAAVPSYTSQATVWAQVRTLSANEIQRAELDSLVASAMHMVTMRKPGLAQPAVSWQVEWEGRRFEVKGILEPDNRQRMMQLVCEEIIHNGA